MSHIEEIIAIHFDPRFGAPYWLAVEKRLGIDARKEIHRREDFFLLGPMHQEDLRHRPLLDFIPRQYHPRLARLILSESGGTTGNPCRRVFLQEEFDHAFVDPWERAATARGFPKKGSWLFLGPGGPHIIGQAARAMARRLGSLEPFSVDCDVRWFKRQTPDSLGFRLYLDHVLAQAVNIMQTQEIDVLFTTPPLLTALHDRLRPDERQRLRGIHLGGLPLDAGQSQRVREELFPGAVILPGYGNSLLGVTFEHSSPLPGKEPTYFVDDPALWLQLVPLPEGDNGSVDLQAVLPAGTRGQVVAHRLDRSFLVINLIERDTARYETYALDNNDMPLCGISGVKPLAKVMQNRAGVY